MNQRNKEIKLSRKDFIANYPPFRYWKSQAVEELFSPAPLNIYVHIPFCAQKCAYCYYHTERYKNPAQVDDFVTALCREIALGSERFRLAGRPVRAIYIGGGTPTLLREKQLETIVSTLRRHFAIDQPEFSLEAEPRTIQADRVKAYKELGVTRISIGVQSFDDEIIKLSGRNHTGKKALEAIDIIRENGGMVVNIDLLSGLAGETDETFGRSVDQAIASGVHNITVYRMEAYLNTEFFSQSVRKKLIELPDEAQELGFMRVALDKFAAADYRPWSFFTFTRRGDFQHQYATNLWRGQDCCVFGPSGFGLLNAYNYQNASIFDSYMALVNEEKLPVIRAFRLSSKDTVLRDILLGFKLYRFDRHHFASRHGFDFCHLIPGTIEELEGQDFIRLEPGSITLGDRGLLYGDYVGKRLAAAVKERLGDDGLGLF